MLHRGIAVPELACASGWERNCYSKGSVRMHRMKHNYNQIDVSQAERVARCRQTWYRYYRLKLIS